MMPLRPQNKVFMFYDFVPLDIPIHDAPGVLFISSILSCTIARTSGIIW